MISRTATELGRREVVPVQNAARDGVYVQSLHSLPKIRLVLEGNDDNLVAITGSLNGDVKSIILLDS
jgi:hypothetical protein